MNRTLSTLALAAVLLGSGLTGCGGTSTSDSPASAQITAAMRSSARELDPEDKTNLDDEHEHERDAAVSRFVSFLDELRQVPALAPLFSAYEVSNPMEMDDDVRGAGLIQLLRAVKITMSWGTVTITNRVTGGVIYTAPRSDLDSGVFHPENMPGAATPPPATACTAFTYSAWGACQSNGSQARTVLTSSPSGCTGGSPATSQACTYVPPTPATCTAFTYSAWGACQSNGTQTRAVASSSPSGCMGGSPATSQACTYVPPVLDGAALYAAKCASCHGPLATSSKRGRTAAQITSAGMTMGLTAAEVQAVANALAVPAPTTCSAFTYSAWGACQSNNTQARTVATSSPSGCTGGTPVTSQACTYVPPVTTCSAFTYSAWGACQSNNTQARTVATSSPSGCTGGTPVTSQACTYVPPVTTCSAFTYSAWGACQSNNTQARTVATSSPSGCTGGTPVTSQACTYVPPVTTCNAFTYSAWGACQSNNTQARTVATSSPSGCTGGTPVTSQACTYVPPVTTCSAFTYSAWGACQSNNTQTRTVLTSSPSGCTGGTRVTSQACTYTPPLDGAALYASKCAGCHGSLASSNLKGKGMSVTSIKSRNMAQGLTDAQLQAVVTAVGP